MKSFSSAEKKWIKDRFPNLRVNSSGENVSISGDLVVDMFYDESLDDRYIIFPDGEVHSSDRYINDVYQIRVEYDNASFVPAVYETSGRIKAFAKRKNVLLADFHINDDSRLCLCPKPLEKRILNNPHTIQDFFARLVIPFFYAHSFFEKFNRWPWKDYSHGDPGILECYAEFISKVQDKAPFIENTISALNVKNQGVLRSGDQITRQTLCFCNSGRKFRMCHHEAWEAAKGLRDALLALA